MAFPLNTTGSLSPTFVPAPPVGVAVKLPSAFALFGWFPTILRESLSASDTLSEATAPVKLPARHCPTAGSRQLVRNPILQGWYPNIGSAATGVTASSLPPILYIQHRIPVSSWSKAPWGLSVLAQVTSIFTGTSISPGALSRQRSNHYAFRAGRNLPDKEFRYLRTVIVTAAVYWGLNSMLRFLTSPLNLPAPGRRQPIYLTFRFRIDLCFC